MFETINIDQTHVFN